MNNKKIITILTIIFGVYIIIIFLFPTNYGPRWGSYGNGWLDKLSKNFFEDNIYRKTFIYLIFYISLISVFAVSQKRLSLIYFSLFFVFISLLIKFLY